MGKGRALHLKHPIPSRRVRVMPWGLYRPRFPVDKWEAPPISLLFHPEGTINTTTTSISLPSRLASKASLRACSVRKEKTSMSMPSRLISKVSLRACSVRMEKTSSDERLDHLKGPDQYLQATPDSVEFDTQEMVSSHVTTTSMPPSSYKQLRSSSKMRFIHYKRKALEKKKRKKVVMVKRKAISTS